MKTDKSINLATTSGGVKIPPEQKCSEVIENSALAVVDKSARNADTRLSFHSFVSVKDMLLTENSCPGILQLIVWVFLKNISHEHFLKF